MSKKVWIYLLVATAVNLLLVYKLHKVGTEKQIQEYHRREAFKILDRLHHGRSPSEDFLVNAETHLHEILAEGNLTLEDVGMTKYSLEDAVVERASEQAHNYLHALRRGCALGVCYTEIRQYLRIARKDPREIGTSEEEIQTHTIKSFRDYMDLMREIHNKGEKIKERYIVHFKRVVQEAGQELVDANTTEQELKNLSQ